MSYTKEIPRPEGWSDDLYKQLVEVVNFASEIEKNGGADGILALVTGQSVGQAIADQSIAKSDVNWIESVPVKAEVSAPGSWTKVTVVLTTDNGHRATCIFETSLAALVFGTHEVHGSLSSNSWDLLKAGRNDITFDIRTGIGQLVVNGVMQGELAMQISTSVAGSIFTSSFDWSA